jgi:hypothetical protein
MYIYSEAHAKRRAPPLVYVSTIIPMIMCIFSLLKNYFSPSFNFILHTTHPQSSQKFYNYFYLLFIRNDAAIIIQHTHVVFL